METRRVLVGTTEGLQELGATERRALEGQEITALARDGDGWWALVGGRTLCRAAGDAAWLDVATVAGPEATCLVATPAGLLVGTAGAHLLRLDDGALVSVEAFERIEGRAAWYTPWGDPADTRSITAGRDGALYVNVHVGGVACSTDGGRSWRATLDIETDVHQVLADPTVAGRVFAAAAVGLVVSEDGGESWRTETEGLHARYCRAVAVSQAAVLVTASTGHRGRRAGLYRRALDGPPGFERCREGLPDSFGDNIDTHCLAAAGSTAVFGTEDGEVYASRDEGSSWLLLAKGLAPVRCLALA